MDGQPCSAHIAPSSRHAAQPLPPHLDCSAAWAVRLPSPLYSPSTTVLRRATAVDGACRLASQRVAGAAGSDAAGAGRQRRCFRVPSPSGCLSSHGGGAPGQAANCEPGGHTPSRQAARPAWLAPLARLPCRWARWRPQTAPGTGAQQTCPAQTGRAPPGCAAPPAASAPAAAAHAAPPQRCWALRRRRREGGRSGGGSRGGREAGWEAGCGCCNLMHFASPSHMRCGLPPAADGSSGAPSCQQHQGTPHPPASAARRRRSER